MVRHRVALAHRDFCFRILARVSHRCLRERMVLAQDGFRVRAFYVSSAVRENFFAVAEGRHKIFFLQTARAERSGDFIFSEHRVHRCPARYFKPPLGNDCARALRGADAGGNTDV